MEGHLKIDLAAGGDHCHDVHDALGYYLNMAPTEQPAILQTHHLFWSGGRRFVLGIESLRGLGRPRDLVRTGISEYQVGCLVGNARSVDYLACEIVTLLAHVNFALPCNPKSSPVARPLVSKEPNHSVPYSMVKILPHHDIAHAHLQKTMLVGTAPARPLKSAGKSQEANRAQPQLSRWHISTYDMPKMPANTNNIDDQGLLLTQPGLLSAGHSIHCEFGGRPTDPRPRRTYARESSELESIGSLNSFVGKVLEIGLCSKKMYGRSRLKLPEALLNVSSKQHISMKNLLHASRDALAPTAGEWRCLASITLRAYSSESPLAPTRALPQPGITEPGEHVCVASVLVPEGSL